MNNKFNMVKQISVKELKEFLNEANKKTYANKKAAKSKPSRLKSEDYHFEKGDLIYHDTYFGTRDFIGEEVVYKNKKPVWGANYFGFILDSNMSEKILYDFLRKALMQNSKDVIPVRGPKEFFSGKWRYKFLAKGDLNNFSGVETISFDGKEVYHCLIHGGFIN